MRRLGVIAVAAFAFAPVASAGVKNACMLVTRADASKALGSSVGAGRHQLLGGFNTCTYAKGRKTVTVQARLLSHGDYLKVVKAIHGTALNASDLSPDAWVYFVKNGISLLVWKHGTQLKFLVLGVGANAVTAARDVAQAALNRV
jgi:hypothetical protein